MTSLDIIICTYNRAFLLDSCLDAVITQLPGLPHYLRGDFAKNDFTLMDVIFKFENCMLPGVANSCQ
jgi:hypothetical protein